MQEGEDVTIIGIGKMTSTAMKVANSLEKEDIHAEVINARFLKPLDSKNISKSIENTKFVVIVEDGTIIGGLGDSIKEMLINNNIKDVKIKCFAYPDEFIKHGAVQELEKLYGIDTESIKKYIKQNIEK